MCISRDICIAGIIILSLTLAHAREGYCSRVCVCVRVSVCQSVNEFSHTVTAMSTKHGGDMKKQH